MRTLQVTFLPQWFLNPYQLKLSDHLSARGVQMQRLERDSLSIIKGLILHRPDVLHLHWLHPFYETPRAWQSVLKLSLSFLGLISLRLSGTRIVWTAHNLRHHEQESARLDRIWTRFVARHADAILAHCETAKRLVVAEFDLPNPKKVHVVPHANYIGSYENQTDRAAARRDLGLSDPAFVILFLGRVRPYKGVLELVDTFRRLQESEAHLVIAGKSLTDEDVGLIKERIGNAANIMYLPGFVPDDRVQVFMNACDAVVLPYRDILTSGAAVLAMSFGKPCIAPRLGCIKDLLDAQGAILYDSDDPDGLPRAMASAVERRNELPAMGAHNRELIEPWSWDRMAQMTLDVYERVCHEQVGLSA